MPVSPKRLALQRAEAARTIQAAEWVGRCDTGNRILRITVGAVRAGVGARVEVEAGAGVVTTEDHEVEMLVEKRGKKLVGYNLYRLDGPILHSICIRIGAKDVRWCNCPTGDIEPVWTNDCKHLRGLRVVLPM